jgi:hypothetical protein
MLGNSSRRSAIWVRTTTPRHAAPNNCKHRHTVQNSLFMVKARLSTAKAQRPAMVSMWRVSVVVDSRYLDEPQCHAPK